MLLQYFEKRSFFNYLMNFLLLLGAILMISIIFTLYSLVCSFIYAQFPKSFQSSQFFFIIYIVWAYMFFIYFSIRKLKLPRIFFQTIYLIFGFWLGFMLYFSLITLLFKLLAKFGYQTPHKFEISIITTAIILIYGFIQNQKFEVRHFGIKIDKPLQSPITIVAVSDVHIGYGKTQRKIDSYVDSINSQNPDLILIAGDLIDDNAQVLKYHLIAKSFHQLHAPLGIFAVTGNHEFLAGSKEAEIFYEEAKIRLIKNEVITLQNGLQIAGLEDKSSRRKISPEELIEKADKLKPIVLLDHQPFKLSKKAGLGFDIQISGHTHRGQMMPLNLVTSLLFEMDHGYRKIGNCHTFVSSGLSLWGPQFRIGTHNEMLVIHLSGK